MRSLLPRAIYQQNRPCAVEGLGSFMDDHESEENNDSENTELL